MSHPLITIHGNSWIRMLTDFSETISLLALGDGKPEVDVELLVSQYHQAVESNRDHIFLGTAHGITQYLNLYAVLPKEGAYDEFKNIYFTGLAASACLKRDGLVELNKYQLRAILRLLDYRLESPYKIRRPDLTKRIKSIITENLVDEHLGKYGWYLIYKCLFNSANDNSLSL